MTKTVKDRQFRPVSVPDVELGGFWGKWQDAVCQSTAETLLDRCVEAGMLKAIDVSQPSPGIVIPIQPWGGTTQMFWDSDLGKSIETIAYSLYRRPNPELEARADRIIDMYEKLQDEDGYLNAWFQRVQPHRRYADIMEQALYNGALPGLSIDGKTFFYDNPLESTGRHHRWKWHHCPCCPPNIARLVTSIGSYMYAVAEDEIAVHLYGESAARLKLANGAEVELRQATNYPWDGAIAFTARFDRPARFALSLRIPEWAAGATLSVNGSMLDLSAHLADGYARIEREWSDGDRVALYLPLTLRPQYANPKVRQDVGRVALMRGPLVYCAEAADNGGDLNAIVLPRELPSAETVAMEELNGAVAVDLAVEREETENWGKALYREEPAARVPHKARFVPYHLWDNRSPGEMLVWVQSGR
ncbi:glycoside hydrolase family 127 protein [Sinorhizobium medicae]|uniref:glycoside hydrolase family 127 protein n=1 Tax=Sinorhizobium medicae TaxID=110321 RepID=UPI00037A7A84|nr:beta-L-arabinofuranosidase domain-containing protein [Sinorhizobium medicae]